MNRNRTITDIERPARKNRVWGECDRLGSFRRISVFATVLFHKKDQKQRRGDGKCDPVPFWSFLEKDTATLYPVGTKVPGLQRGESAPGAFPNALNGSAMGSRSLNQPGFERDAGS